MFARRSYSFFEAHQVLNCSKIDARTLRLQFIERGEKGVIGAIEDRNVDPINAATRRSDEAVGKFYQLAEIVGLEPRPSTECPKTEMIAKRDIWWDMRREVSDLGEVSLDGSFNRISGNAAVRILYLSRAVPLDGKIRPRNILDNFGNFGACRFFVAGPHLFDIVLFRKDARWKNAVDHWDRDLEAQMGW